MPYSTGRWIWDPRFGWTWLETAPWGWAPYHYGRWVFVGRYWAWAPGPVRGAAGLLPPRSWSSSAARVMASAARSYWAPLGWGEPVHPVVGPAAASSACAWWGGWGGPRVVNNVVINRTTTVNVTNITVYRNVEREQRGGGRAGRTASVKPASGPPV